MLQAVGFPGAGSIPVMDSPKVHDGLVQLVALNPAAVVT